MLHGEIVAVLRTRCRHNEGFCTVEPGGT